MEFQVLEMISKDLGSGGKRLPTVGYQLTSQDADLLEHVLSVGYRHFMFEPCFTQVLADTLQEYAGDEDIFLTLRVPVHTGKFRGVGEIVQKALSMLALECIDMVLLYDNKRGSQQKQEESQIWKARWKELENLFDRGIARNVGLYADDANVVKLIHATSQRTPAVVFIPATLKSQTSQRAQVVTLCQSLGYQLGVALDADTLKSSNGDKKPAAKILCRAVVESGHSFAVSSESESRIIETSEVFDHALTPRQKHDMLKAAGLTL